MTLDEDSEAGCSWNIKENNQQQFEIECCKTNQIIDASNGNTDIRVRKAGKSKNKKSKSSHDYYYNSYGENWAANWLLTNDNGAKIDVIGNGESMPTSINLNKIDINVVDANNRSALAHAISAKEHGIDSVGTKISYK